MIQHWLEYVCTQAPPQISPYSQLLLSSQYIYRSCNCECVRGLIGWKCGSSWSYWQCYPASLGRWQLLYYSHTLLAAAVLHLYVGLESCPYKFFTPPPLTQFSSFDRHEIAPLLRLLLTSEKQLSSSRRTGTDTYRPNMQAGASAFIAEHLHPPYKQEYLCMHDLRSSPYSYNLTHAKPCCTFKGDFSKNDAWVLTIVL